MFKLTASVTLFALLLIVTMLMGSAAAFAQGDNRGQGSRLGKPPPAAFDACASSSANAVCTVQTPQGASLPGVCFSPPQLQSLVCVPDQHRQQGRGTEAGALRNRTSESGR